LSDELSVRIEDHPDKMATSQCWLKGMDVINAAERVMEHHAFRRGARKANVKALRHTGVNS
jgi:hypothetical protein